MQASSNSRHHVVFCADRNYLPYFGVTAYSLLANNASHGLSITVITDEIDASQQVRLDRLAHEFDTPITAYRLTDRDRADLQAVKPHGHLGIATYFRLLIPRALPDTLARVLYLDSDMIVDGDIANLFASAGAGKLVGVCPDPVGRSMTGNPGYFNAGVMQIDLERWRALDVSRKATAYATGRNDLRFCDQDALNAIVDATSIHWLGLEYNYMVFDRLRPDLQRLLDREVALVAKPKILHFTGAIKPWHAWFMGAYQQKYLDYVRRSPWRDDPGVLKSQATTVQQELWLGEAAEKAQDFRKAAAHYKRVAQHLLQRL